MVQLTKEEILQQILGLNSGDLVELESTIQLMNKLGISNESKIQYSNLSSDKTKNQRK